MKSFDNLTNNTSKRPSKTRPILYSPSPAILKREVGAWVHFSDSPSLPGEFGEDVPVNQPFFKRQPMKADLADRTLVDASSWLTHVIGDWRHLHTLSSKSPPPACASSPPLLEMHVPPWGRSLRQGTIMAGGVLTGGRMGLLCHCSRCVVVWCDPLLTVIDSTLRVAKTRGARRSKHSVAQESVRIAMSRFIGPVSTSRPAVVDAVVLPARPRERCRAKTVVFSALTSDTLSTRAA